MEVVVGTYEELILGYKLIFSEDVSTDAMFLTY